MLELYLSTMLLLISITLTNLISHYILNYSSIYFRKLLYLLFPQTLLFIEHKFKILIWISVNEN